MPYFLGVDVGTASVRAGIFDEIGQLHGQDTQPIQIFYPQVKFIEQSSENIWMAVCRSVKNVVEIAKIEKKEILGIGFDATCSLVILSKDQSPISASVNSNSSQNVILWMDHRAEKEAERINESKSRILDFVGGKISPEMEIPKLLWLKENNKETWEKAGFFFDLPDFLTWKATGLTSRSICSTTCKWTYLSKENRWDEEFLKAIGLEDLVFDRFEKIGTEILNLGDSVGGLTKRAADDLGLETGTKVSVSIIDAHAGTIGTIGASRNFEIQNSQGFKPDQKSIQHQREGFELKEGEIGEAEAQPSPGQAKTSISTSPDLRELNFEHFESLAEAEFSKAKNFETKQSTNEKTEKMKSPASKNWPLMENFDFNSRISLICGTSDCVMALSPNPRFISGVWGPYFSAVLPDFWLNEGGQSATGALLDHLFVTNPGFQVLKSEAEAKNLHFTEYLNHLLFDLSDMENLELPILTKDLHILPYFHGNRSPRADPSLRGSIIGLNLSNSRENLLKLYLATVQSIALGHRHIIDELNRSGYSVKEIMVTGGGAKNRLYLQEIANSTKCEILLCENSEAMILGSAILASVAAGYYGNLHLAMGKMSKIFKSIQPNSKFEDFYAKKFAVFLQMHDDQKKYRKIMEK